MTASARDSISATTRGDDFTGTALLPGRLVALILFCAATILLIPLESTFAGLAAAGGSLVFTLRQPDAPFRLIFGVLLGCVVVLGFAPIHTGLDPGHFISLGMPFLTVVVVPWLVIRRYAPPTGLDGTFWPRGFSLRDTVYTILSVPLAWGVIELYFFHLTPEMPTHWLLPPEWNEDAVRRLTTGINCVGIWDELFFINTCYVLLRRLFPAWLSNLAQAVVYTSVLYHMAFTGAGIVIVYLFALTQGVMYERSRVLFYVLVVHLIVDVFLVLAILQHYYPGNMPSFFF